VHELIRVGFTTLAPFISGAERSLQVTLRYLPEAGVEPHVIGPASSPMSAWCKLHGIRYLNCDLALRDRWHAWRWWTSVRRLRRILRSAELQVTHSNQVYSYPAVAAAAAVLGIPRVCHLRDDLSEDTVRWFCPTALDVAVCISKNIRNQAERAWARSIHRPVMVTMPNPVELPDLPPPAVRRQRQSEARRRWGLLADETVFGFIGQLREVKGLIELIEVVATLKGRRSWRLLVAGHDPLPGAPYEQSCRERAASLGIADRLIFVGHLEDTGAYYDAIDVAIVPSHQEPLGRVPLEAAAAAKPSAAMAVGGLPEVVIDGETGWLAPAGDWSGLAAILDRFLEAPDHSIGAKARVWVENVASPQRYARELAELYRSRLVKPAGGQVETPGTNCRSAATEISTAV